MVKYMVLYRYTDEYTGETFKGSYKRDGKGFTYENADRLVAMLKSCGFKATSVVMSITDDEN